MSAYIIAGEAFPSVTDIVGQLDKSSALIPWALNCFELKLNLLLAQGVQIEEAIVIAKKDYQEVSKEALDIGSQVHHAIEQYIKGDKDLVGNLKDEVANGFLAFLEWEALAVDKWLEVEVKTAHLGIGYAGTYDGIFQHKDGRIILVDFKTSKDIYSSYWLQVAAYKEARESLCGEYSVEFKRDDVDAVFHYDLPKIKIDDVAILRLDKTSGYPDYRERKKDNHDFEAFRHLVGFYYNEKKRRLKNNSIVKKIWSK